MAIAKRPKRAKKDEKRIEAFIGGAEMPMPNLEVVPKAEKPKGEDKVPLNFSVLATVKRRFETAKFNTGKTMVTVLEEALTLWEKENSQ